MFKSFGSVTAILVVCTQLALAQSAALPPSPSQELNTVLMHATFLIAGQKKNEPTQAVFGTVFIMGIPIPNNPGVGQTVLVTADHVLDDIGTDEAVMLVRRKNADGSYATFDHHIRIREQGKPLYVHHKTADVAAMYIDLPNDVPVSVPPPDFLVDDKRVEDIDLHPGDEAFCLGFPLAASSPGGFPILRTGHIASYPLTPMRDVKAIYFDLFLDGANSGGPIYYYYTNRVINKTMNLGSVSQEILGLVTQQIHSSIPDFSNRPLNFGVIVPAPFISETIAMLPASP
jgi:hypothetical protein